jgi:hypothetical protein
VYWTADRATYGAAARGAGLPRAAVVRVLLQDRSFTQHSSNYPVVLGMARSARNASLHCSSSHSVCAAPVRDDVPEEKECDWERTLVFDGEHRLVASARQTSGEAYRPSAFGIGGDRAIAEEANPRLVVLSSAEDLEFVYRVSLRAGDEHLFAAHDHPVASTQGLECDHVILAAKFGGRSTVQTQPPELFPIGRKKYELRREEEAADGEVVASELPLKLVSPLRRGSWCVVHRTDQYVKDIVEFREKG